MVLHGGRGSSRGLAFVAALAAGATLSTKKLIVLLFMSSVSRCPVEALRRAGAQPDVPRQIPLGDRPVRGVPPPIGEQRAPLQVTKEEPGGAECRLL